MAVEITELISQLPVMFQYIQIFTYIVLTLFFGAAALKGWKGFVPWYFKWPFRIVTGFACLIVGISIAEYIPVLSTGIFRLFQAHIIAAGILASIIMAVALYLISIKLPSTAESYRREIQRLQDKVKKMKDKKPSKAFVITGVVIIAGLLVFAVINWKGFPPSIADEVLSTFGIVPGPGMSMFSPECLSLFDLVREHQEVMKNPSVYENDVLKSAMKNFGNAPVLELYKAEHEGQVIILGLLENGLVCISTETEVCACIEQGPAQ